MRKNIFIEQTVMHLTNNATKMKQPNIEYIAFYDTPQWRFGGLFLILHLYGNIV